jgi:hypothetical protein
MSLASPQFVGSSSILVLASHSTDFRGIMLEHIAASGNVDEVIATYIGTPTQTKSAEGNATNSRVGAT